MSLSLGMKKSKIALFAIAGYLLLMIISFGAWALYYMTTHWENDYGGLFYSCLVLEVMFLGLVFLFWFGLKGKIIGLRIDKHFNFTFKTLFVRKSFSIPLEGIEGYSKNLGLLVIYLKSGATLPILDLFIEDFNTIEIELNKIKVKYLGEENYHSDGFGNLTSPKYSN